MDTILIQRANVILEVDEELKGRYMAEGYSVIDEKGKVIEAAIPVNKDELRNTVKALTEKLEASEKNVHKLKEACKKLKAELEKYKAEDKPEGTI